MKYGTSEIYLPVFLIIPNPNPSSSPAHRQSLSSTIPAVVVIILPIFLVLSVALYKNHRAKVLRQRVENLEKLYHQKYRKS